MKKIDKTGIIFCLFKFLGNAVLGAFVALAVHYYLYRVGLPISPFIYQVF